MIHAMFHCASTLTNTHQTSTEGDVVLRVRVVEPDGQVRWREREELGLRYRGSALGGCLVLAVELGLRSADPQRLRQVPIHVSRGRWPLEDLSMQIGNCRITCRACVC